MYITIETVTDRTFIYSVLVNVILFGISFLISEELSLSFSWIRSGTLVATAATFIVFGLFNETCFKNYGKYIAVCLCAATVCFL